MKSKMKKTRKSIAILTTLAMILSLESGVTMPRKAQAADYGLKNPTTDSNGVTTWDCVYFGNYWQEDTNGDGIANQNDEKQHIKWRVLSVDGDDAFLLADQNLDERRYNELYADVTWETCTLRSWLNGYSASSNVENTDYSSDNFMDTAFTAAEQKAILRTDVVNEDNLYYDTEGGNDTMDQVYLLSIAEASNAAYGFKSTYRAESKTRISTNTAYTAGKNSGMSSVGTTDWWWLRSPGYDSYGASNVFGNGSGGYNNNVNDHNVAVRPALHLNLSSSDLWSYGGTVSSEGGSQTTNTPTPSGVSTGGVIRNLKNPVTDSKGVSTWDCVYFGNYWQEDTNGDGVVDENDEKQPVKWRILSVVGKDAFLLADQNLDARQYNTSYRDDVTWETCTLRSWLNGYGASANIENTDYSSDNFINTAFTVDERRAILQTNVYNMNYETMDQVYLLSSAEASNASYGFNSRCDISSKTREARNTSYVKKQGALNTRGNGNWWLRSPGGRGYWTSDDNGSIGYGDYYDDLIAPNSVAVRPVLHLNLSATDLWSYAGTVSAEGGSPTTMSQTPVPSATSPADSTNSPAATMTGVPSASASPSADPSETSAGTLSPEPTKTPTAKPAGKPSFTPKVKPTKAPDTNASAVQDLPMPAPSDAQPSSSQSPAGTQQPSGSSGPAASIRPDGIGSTLPSATAGMSVTASPKTTASSSKAPEATQTLHKGQVFKDVKTKAYYKILSVTATGGKAAYLRPVDKKVKKVTVKDTVTFKGKKFKITQIGNKAFKDYKKLQKVTIGRKVSVIGKKTFANCKSLKAVILTGPKQKLPKNAFAGCPRKPKVRKEY